MNNDDISEAVRCTAVLADVTISMWGGERSDTGMLKKVKEDAGAVGNVGRVTKNLLAGADGLLKDTKSAFSAVRMVHYSLTLPWVSDPHAERQRGPRLLPNMLWDRYTTAVATKRREAYDTRDKFITEYPDLVERAKHNLGGLADDGDYPTAEQVRDQFKIGLGFEPIPAGVAFRGLPDQVLGKLAASLQRKQERMILSARDAMWAEARERLMHFATRLSDPEAKFRLTTVESVRELVTLLPAWNVSGDDRVLEVAGELEEMLHGIGAEDLRKDALVRSNISKQAQEVVDKLSQWGL